MNHLTFQLGLLFPDGNTLKLAIKEYAIQNGKDIYFKRNEPQGIRAQCSKEKVCPWVCYAAKRDDTEDFIIKTYNPVHKCSRSTKNRFATSDWLANNYAINLKCRKRWNVEDFMSQVKKDHVIDMSRPKAYRA